MNIEVGQAIKIYNGKAIQYGIVMGVNCGKKELFL